MASPKFQGVNAARYVVRGRMPMRAGNDNPHPHRAPAWYWAVAVGAVPTFCVAVLLSIFL